jgi:acyl carrier protein|tara:strand:+ start:922 stop:1182 length:261 start_codon:yes stop_codon:yes gene_type:complete
LCSIKGKLEFSEVEKIIADFFVEREGNEILKEIRELNFIEEGILDSLDIVFLATYLEEKFSIKIDITDDNILKTFSNFENIVKLVS